MTKNRGRKQRARRAKERNGASYTSAASGTAHDHGGPQLPDLDGADYGRQGQFSMTAVSRLLGECLADCQPCQRTLTRRLMDGQRIIIAGLARDLYAPQPKISTRCSATTHRFHEVCRDGATAAAFVEDLPRHELSDLLEDALDTWTGQMTMGEALAATPDPDEAAEDKPRRVVTLSCAYQVTAGAEEYLGPEEIKHLLKRAESSATGGEALECSLCDQPIDVLSETEVNLGLTTFPVGGREGIQPVALRVHQFIRWYAGGYRRLAAVGLSGVCGDPHAISDLVRATLEHEPWLPDYFWPTTTKRNRPDDGRRRIAARCPAPVARQPPVRHVCLRGRHLLGA